MPAQLYEVLVRENAKVASDIMRMTVQLPAGAAVPCAGQFYMLRAWDADEAPLLSRPISVHEYDAEENTLVFLYQIKGEGTQKLAALNMGETLRITGPSGHGFPLEKLSGKVALVGGGIGTAPLLQLAKELKANGATVDFFGGWREEVYALEDFAAVCDVTAVATDTGSMGTKGFVTDIVPYGEYSAVCTCGPEIVMQKVAAACKAAGVTCWVSREAKMACGIGACLGCTCKTKNGAKSVCKDGPVFNAEEVYGDD